MSAHLLFARLAVATAVLGATLAGPIDAQPTAPPRRPPEPSTQGAQPRRPEQPGQPGQPGRAVPRRQPPPTAHPVHPVHPAPAVVHGRVFVGGYLYDPAFGPYPWWPRRVYPHGYYPIYDARAFLRLRVEPEDASIYVDGFYAGIVEDFDGFFEGLPLPPGGHRVVLYRDGYRTSMHSIYFRPGSTFTLRETLERLPAGVRSEPPELAPAVPPPPAGSYATPRTLQPLIGRPPIWIAATGFGTLDLSVQPATASVRIDGFSWATSEAGHFVVQTPVGRHRIVVEETGFQRFETEIEVREGEAMPLNVSLVRPTS